jgi:hypothetical protein
MSRRRRVSRPPARDTADRACLANTLPAHPPPTDRPRRRRRDQPPHARVRRASRAAHRRARRPAGPPQPRRATPPGAPRAVGTPRPATPALERHFQCECPIGSPLVPRASMRTIWCPARGWCRCSGCRADRAAGDHRREGVDQGVPDSSGHHGDEVAPPPPSATCSGRFRRVAGRVDTTADDRLPRAAPGAVVYTVGLSFLLIACHLRGGGSRI